MDTSYLLNSLNKAQREAVTAPAGHHLVLAGAGSGKTRVLVHRIAWLIQSQGISPFNLLAVTFTNKGAGEMRGRIEKLLGIPMSSMWVGTFHGLAHRLLRTHWQDAQLPQDFQILDSEDQYRLIRRILQNLNLDEARWSPRKIQWFINSRKDEGLRFQHLEDDNNPYTRQMIRIYHSYQGHCERNGLVDFAELLLRTHELWRDHSELLRHYQNRFTHILIDEFQDTNAIQYAWLQLLVGDKGELFIVGDDDQSIYGWRGARIENIQQLTRDFPTAHIVRLEQNYRSTGIILAAANAVIANNAERLGKNLWTDGEDGEPIQIYRALNERDEARFVVERIQAWQKQGGVRSDAAVLYRSNAQSRILEETLLQVGMPYRVHGGLRFFERAEIKDALAYLRLVIHRDNDPAFERVINTPPRGIGKRTLSQVRELARQEGLSLWQATAQLITKQCLPARSAKALRQFHQLIENIAAAITELSLPEQTEHILEHSGLLSHYSKDRSEKGQSRLENLGELINATSQFKPEDLNFEPLSEFLAHASLEAGDTQAEDWEDCVQLMTLHAAKGLEFPLVFIIGMEEGLFPSPQSLDEPARLEEERRLCYVGMTRARYHLYLAHAEHRWLYGSDSHPKPSRFIHEIPTELTYELQPHIKSHIKKVVRSSYAPQPKESFPPGTGFQFGQRVIHHKFGEGVVLNLEGAGNHMRVQVNFHQIGTKWLAIAYAKLQIV
jgi:DNA helicase-2/ATP-dependent DNA helicase PcrA